MTRGRIWTRGILLDFRKKNQTKKSSYRLFESLGVLLDIVVYWTQKLRSIRVTLPWWSFTEIVRMRRGNLEIG
ncbi:MAG: hypothetical protein ACI9G1_001092 [Pirellulaceae bacterium]|jgi:hypothetical protein